MLAAGEVRERKGGRGMKLNKEGYIYNDKKDRIIPEAMRSLAMRSLGVLPMRSLGV